MPSRLSIDLGNTSFKVAVFRGKELQLLRHFTPKQSAALLAFCKKQNAEAAILASVVKNSQKLERGLARFFPLLKLDARTPLPIQNKYATPATLGYDRLAGAIGGWQLFEGSNVLVVEAGTCVKYDLVNNKGQYLGGAIAPGLRMRFEALHAFTQKLPLLRPAKKAPLLGRTTDESVRAGAQEALVAETEGMIAAYRKQLPRLRVIVGGGDAAFFAERLKTRIFVRPNIVAEGLNYILDYNVENDFLE